MMLLSMLIHPSEELSLVLARKISTEEPHHLGDYENFTNGLALLITKAEIKTLQYQIQCIGYLNENI